jgi:formylglycine-generating enzyme required for sulfatase activity
MNEVGLAMVHALKVGLAVLLVTCVGHAGQPQATPPGGEPCDGVLVPVAPSNSGVCIKPGSGASFKDCPECPEMVVVPAGSFIMGSPQSDPGGIDQERPQHKVQIGKPFGVSPVHRYVRRMVGLCVGRRLREQPIAL